MTDLFLELHGLSPDESKIRWKVFYKMLFKWKEYMKAYLVTGLPLSMIIMVIALYDSFDVQYIPMYLGIQVCLFPIFYLLSMFLRIMIWYCPGERKQ